VNICKPSALNATKTSITPSYKGKSGKHKSSKNSRPNAFSLSSVRLNVPLGVYGEDLCHIVESNGFELRKGFQIEPVGMVKIHKYAINIEYNVMYNQFVPPSIFNQDLFAGSQKNVGIQNLLFQIFFSRHLIFQMDDASHYCVYLSFPS